MMSRIIELVVAGCVRDSALRDSICGDLHEEYESIAAEQGAVAAAWWLGKQLLTSLPHLASLTPNRDPNCFTLGMIGRLYGVFAGILVLSVVLAEGIAWFAGQSKPWVAVIPSVACAAAIGFLAALLARRVPLVAALAVGILSVAFCAGAALLGNVRMSPLAWTAFQAMVIPATVAGGLVRVEQIVRPHRRLT